MVNIDDRVLITSVCSEAGNYAKSKQGKIGVVKDIDATYIYVDFGDGNDNRESDADISGFPFLLGEYELCDRK
ncbi:hypothetical protein Lepto7375DRAFT_7277 [Leptolyngbya sp. PCC 7375]|nr:hypothetical protein Lepto7375DRAFT_7277 [Leptolyngbya sp. PCC 7375]